MLLVDTAEHVIIRDEELKLTIARSRPHSDWLKQLVTLEDFKASSAPVTPVNGHSTARDVKEVNKQFSLFSYTLETLTLLLTPMFTTK